MTDIKYLSPNDGFATSVVPVDAAEHIPAATAVYYLREDVIAAVGMAFARGVDLYGSPANKFFLD